MNSGPCYKLTLHKTYYEKGFFNLGVDVDRFVTACDGADIVLTGEPGLKTRATVNRRANTNGTPRIIGGVVLRDWLTHNYDLLAEVAVTICAPDHLHLQPMDDIK